MFVFVPIKLLSLSYVFPDYQQKALDCVDYSAIDELADDTATEETFYKRGLDIIGGGIKDEGIVYFSS